MRPSRRNLPPVCLITGATEGVGKATASKLSALRFTVVIAARNPDKGAAVASDIEATSGGHVDAGDDTFRPLRDAHQRPL